MVFTTFGSIVCPSKSDNLFFSSLFVFHFFRCLSVQCFGHNILKYILVYHLGVFETIILTLGHHILHVISMQSIKSTKRTVRVSVVTLTNLLSMHPGTDVFIEGGGGGAPP